MIMKNRAGEHVILRRFRVLYFFVAIITSLTMTAVLLLSVVNLPEYGKTGNPVENEVFRRYVEDGLRETGAVNIVTAIILDYRAFDTLGEAIVLFLALVSVLMFLKAEKGVLMRLNLEQNKYEPARDQIFQSIASVVVPCVLLFGAYIVLNGHLSAGGGFAGGAVLGAALIMYNTAFGLSRSRMFINEKVFRRLVSGALIFYAVVKGYSFFTGGNHLPYIIPIPLGEPGSIFSGGLILPLNIAVGVIVSCTIYGFFCLFNQGEV